MMKRLFDIVMSILFLVLLLPIMLFISLLVRLNLGQPILFRQQRPGLNGEPFEMVKFRTMLNDRTSDSDAERLTRFGRMLRASSLDELPELWNVFKGDMSLVGPRPLLMEYLPLYSEQQSRRHEVRPGITGLAQINGRNAISWQEKFKLDVWYVDNRSFWLDMEILFMTVKKVVVREGISAKGDATMPVFTGKASDSNE